MPITGLFVCLKFINVFYIEYSRWAAELSSLSLLLNSASSPTNFHARSPQLTLFVDIGGLQDFVNMAPCKVLKTDRSRHRLATVRSVVRKIYENLFGKWRRRVQKRATALKSCTEAKEAKSVTEGDDDENLTMLFTDWGPLQDISDSAYIKLAVQYRQEKDSGNDLALLKHECEVVGKYRGCNNLVRILKFSDGSKVCVRVPACGWVGKWIEDDATFLRVQVRTMEYIKQNTNFPLAGNICIRHNF